LAEQGGRMASTSPEGNVFDLMGGQYSKQGIAQFDVYLKGHSGDDLITDRVSRKSVRVEQPALTCAYAMQPEVIKGLIAKAAFLGRGLLPRFLYGVPQSWIGQRQVGTNAVPKAVAEAFRAAVRSLFESCESKLDETAALRLSDSASSLLLEWEAEIESMLADGGELETIRFWGGKLAGATVRIAAVLHCVQHGPIGEIGRPIIAAAIEIARHLIPHAEAAFSLMEAKDDSGASAGATYLLKWIRRHGLREFTKRHAQQHGKRRFRKAEDIDPALTELSKRGYIRLRPLVSSGPGRPPSPTFVVNPAVFDKAKPEKRSHNYHNLAEPTDKGSSENSENDSEQFDNSNRVQVEI
jgi:hypothetical protein